MNKNFKKKLDPKEMDFVDLNKEVILNVLIKISYEDLNKICSIHDNIQNICDLDEFWLRKIKFDYLLEDYKEYVENYQYLLENPEVLENFNYDPAIPLGYGNIYQELYQTITLPLELFHQDVIKMLKLGFRKIEYEKATISHRTEKLKIQFLDKAYPQISLRVTLRFVDEGDEFEGVIQYNWKTREFSGMMDQFFGGNESYPGKSMISVFYYIEESEEFED